MKQNQREEVKSGYHIVILFGIGNSSLRQRISVGRVETGGNKIEH